MGFCVEAPAKSATDVISLRVSRKPSDRKPSGLGEKYIHHRFGNCYDSQREIGPPALAPTLSQPWFRSKSSFA